MTKLLNKAIAEARRLPPEEQDALGAIILAKIEAGRTMRLSKRDTKTFLDAILDPPKPNARLRKALLEHSRRVIAKKAGGTPADDPFAAFDEWNSPEDEKAFRDH